MESAGELYVPGPAGGARVEKHGETWTLILVRELRHAPPMVWEALTDPAQLREWAPYELEGEVREGSAVELTWAGTGQVTEARVHRAEAPRLLELGDMRWELEAQGAGTRLTLWHSIDRRFVAWGAAGWHMALDVLERRMSGHAIGRLAGADAMRHQSWQRLCEEYARQFGAELPGAKR